MASTEVASSIHDEGSGVGLTGLVGLVGLLLPPGGGCTERPGGGVGGGPKSVGYGGE